MANQKDLLDNLAVLGCPCAVQDVNTLASQSAIIIWLEDRKIRSLDIEERHGLKTIDNKWAESVAQYFSNLDCPFQWVPQQSENIITDSNYECLLWLSQEAITFEFQDEMDSMEVITETNIDISDVVYQNLIHKLQITNDVGATNEDIIHIISSKVKSVKLFCEWLHADGSNISADEIQQKYKTFLEAGGAWLKDSNDVVKEVSTAIRMLYLSEFRELQNEANSLMVIAQDYTANPKLNSALGKVGR